MDVTGVSIIFQLSSSSRGSVCPVLFLYSFQAAFFPGRIPIKLRAKIPPAVRHGLAPCLIFAALICLSGCAKPTLFEFTHGDKPGAPTYIAATIDKTVITQARRELALPMEKRTLHISGAIERGNAGYNTPWRWHFIENEWNLVFMSMEVCDGQPSYVDENLDQWISEVRSYCPWVARVSREVR